MQVFKANWDGTGIDCQGAQGVIKDYIESFNSQCGKLSRVTGCDFLIIYYSLNDLIWDHHCLFAQDYFIDDFKERNRFGIPEPGSSGKIKPEYSCLYWDVDHSNRTEDGSKLPIIHITAIDFISSENDIALGLLKSKANRFISIIDSSIWNYYVPVAVNNVAGVESYDFQRLDSAITSISANTNFEIEDGDVYSLYHLNITREYADFQARMLIESYLFKRKSGHGTYVSPFIFHSEHFIKNESKRLYEELHPRTHDDKTIIDKIKEYKWRILLIDDKIGVGDNGYLSLAVDGKAKVTKTAIVVNRIRQYFKAHGIEVAATDENREAHIYIDAVQNLKTAIERLHDNKYEIVLLDYLLDKPSIGQSQEREYSYELLTEIKKDGEIEEIRNRYYKYGPHKRLYFMFISAFATAVNERLRAAGLHKSKDYWHIGDGACPTNTPDLFIFNLLHLMAKRLDDCGVDKLSIDRIVNNTLRDIYGDEDMIRENANAKFNRVLSLLYHYKSLLEDVVDSESSGVTNMRGSALATSFIQNNPYHGALLEHIVQLVYLTAFGTIRQWPEMWNEYHYIRTILEAVGHDNNEQLDNIERYILKLKNGNQ